MGDILKPVIEFDGARVFHGSCLDILPTLADNSVDAVVCDPPYELGFMGKKWDSSGIAFNVEVWEQCLRVLKPGGHLLAFGGSRTWHRLAVAIEDAGFELRDSIAWLYGSGFPKSLDISKAIDKAADVERKVVTETVIDLFGEREEDKKKLDISSTRDRIAMGNGWKGEVIETVATTDDAKKWQGWGTALKPAFEPVVVARKPVEGTVANNVLVWGVGGLNIDGTRISGEAWKRPAQTGVPFDGNWKSIESESNPAGRWPSNVMLDEYTAALVDEQSGESVSKSGGISSRETAAVYGKHKSTPRGGHDDSGGASRFFYVAKASKRDRNEGLENLEERERGQQYGLTAGTDNPQQTPHKNEPVKNFHPTVKPTDLMRQLVRLVTPPGGTVLDPFTGSGSTGKAALLEGFDFIGCELTEDYLPIIEGRLQYAIDTVQAEQKAESERKNETLF